MGTNIHGAGLCSKCGYVGSASTAHDTTSIYRKGEPSKKVKLDEYDFSEEDSEGDSESTSDENEHFIGAKKKALMGASSHAALVAALTRPKKQNKKTTPSAI